MRLFLQYLRQHWRVYVVGGLFCVIFLLCFCLYHLPMEALFYPTFLCVSVGLAFLAGDFWRVRGKHEKLKRIRSITDTQIDSFPRIESVEEADYQEIIRLMREEYNDYQVQTNQRYADMADYYSVWAHQIKTPIASMRLNLQNEDSMLARKIFVDLRRVEQYVEMVLTFLRLNSESTDYLIKEYDLDCIVRQAVKKFSHEFIGRKLRLEYEPLNERVITDEKWLSFVIEQILSNALKYTQAGGITIFLEDRRLHIRDTGIGIASEDLPRIFENGYTGYNGRLDKTASGIGLYLCKRICSNLGHEITASSIVDEGTTIIIDFTQKKLEVE